MEGVMRIELISTQSKCVVLPLDYTPYIYDFFGDTLALGLGLA